MKPKLTSEKTIYVQIAESIENDILNHILEEEMKVLSTNQLAVMYRINPATAAKGLNILVEENIIYKKRGIGMFVATGAVERIRKKRKKAFSKLYIKPLLEEAKHLNLNTDDVLNLIKDSEVIS